MGVQFRNATEKFSHASLVMLAQQYAHFFHYMAWKLYRFEKRLLTHSKRNTDASMILYRDEFRNSQMALEYEDF